MLKEIFWMQAVLQAAVRERRGDALTPDPLSTVKDEDLTRYTKENILALVAELTEVLEETNWKPWKTPDPGRPIRGRVRAELVDAMHFMVNLFITWGITPETLYAEYRAKHLENMRRQEAGY